LFSTRCRGGVFERPFWTLSAQIFPQPTPKPDSFKPFTENRLSVAESCRFHPFSKMSQDCHTIFWPRPTVQPCFRLHFFLRGRIARMTTTTTNALERSLFPQREPKGNEGRNERETKRPAVARYMRQKANQTKRNRNESLRKETK